MEVARRWEELVPVAVSLAISRGPCVKPDLAGARTVDVSRPDHSDILLVHHGYCFETESFCHSNDRRVDNVEAEIRVRRDQLAEPNPVFGGEIDDVDLKHHGLRDDHFGFGNS